MTRTYYIPWSAYGLATVEADTERAAKDIAVRTFCNIHPSDFGIFNVDYIECDPTTEEL